MRLIDADSLLLSMNKGIQGTAREYLRFYQMAVNDEPTAYDVDKVVDGLGTNHAKLREPPCRPGDYALLSNGSIVPVIYVTYTEDDIEVGCQNGINVSMDGRSAYRCSGFYRTRREAQEALERMGNEKG